MTSLSQSVHSCRIAAKIPDGPADYAGGSIANLSATIAQGFGAPAGGAPLSDALDNSLRLSERLAEAATVMLVVLDGVGMAQLERHMPDGCLAAHQHSDLTSVFPSSTAPAITSLMTGLTPAAHGTAAWFIHHERPDTIFRSLPMDVRGDPVSPAPADLWSWGGWMRRARGDFYGFQPDFICDSAYSRQALAGAQRLGYREPSELPARLAQIARQQNRRRQFVYVYLPQFDTISHQFGCESEQAAQCLRAFDSWFEQLLTAVRNTPTLVVAVADHGFIDVLPESQHEMTDFPEIQRCLVAPLAGEPRAVFCRVAPSAQEGFEQKLANSTLSQFCDVYSSADLLRAGWFGPDLTSAPASPDLLARIGSHTLVMRDGHTLVDAVPGEQAHQFVGMHGGIMAAEMSVPLILAGTS